MAYSTKLDARYWRSWPKEDYPSTRDSMRTWNKNFPVNKTLTTPGTAEDLITVDPGDPTINLVTNPSMETGAGPTGYTASGATITRDNTYYLYGSYSLKITPDDSVANEGAYWSLGNYPHNVPLSVSCYVRDAAASGDTAMIRIIDTSGNVVAESTEITLSTSWQRATVTTVYSEESRGSSDLRLYIVTGDTKHGTAFWADGLQAESLDSVTTYCDGTQGLEYEWFGTAHASESRRYPLLSTIRGGHFHATRDCYVAYDTDASNSATNEEDRGEFIKAGTDWCFDHPVLINEKISFINYWPGEQPNIYGILWGVPDKQHIKG